MTTFRIRKTSCYTTIANSAIQDTRLSFRARGIHHLLLSYPDDWVVHLNQLADQSSKEGRDAINTAVKELENFRYIARKQTRKQTGCYGSTEFDVFEVPEDSTSSPCTENPLTVEPLTVNPSLLKKNNTNNLNTPLNPPKGGTSNNGRKTKKSKKKVPTVSQTNPEIAETCYGYWVELFQEVCPDRQPGRAGFMNGFDMLVNGDTLTGESLSPEKIAQAVKFYCSNKLAAIRDGKSPVSPPSAEIFFRGKKQHPDSYAIAAFQMVEANQGKSLKGSDINRLINTQQIRLGFPGQVQAGWVDGCTGKMVSQLSIEEKIKYHDWLTKLPGQAHAA